MRVRNIVLTGIAVVVVVGLIVLWNSRRSGVPVAALPSAPQGIAVASATPAVAATPAAAVPSPPPPVTGAEPAKAVASSNAPAAGIAASPAETPAQEQVPQKPMDRAEAMGELFKVHKMIGSYHTLMGQNPVGTNAEIMKALMGGNPRGAMLGPPPGQTLNGNGELVDPWGTPYFFHQLSGNDMEIHSAGPDKIMGTADDLVIH